MAKDSNCLPFVPTSLPMTANQQIYFKITTYITFKLAKWGSLVISKSASMWQQLLGAFLIASSSFSSPREPQSFAGVHPPLHSQ